MDMVNTNIDTSTIDDLVQGIMNTHGFQHKTQLTLDDFQTVMNQYSNELDDSRVQGMSAFGIVD